MRNFFLILGLLLTFQVSASTFIAGPALYEGYNNITSSGGTTVLTTLSETNQIVLGTSAHTVRLPDSTTLKIGRRFDIINNSSMDISVENFVGSMITTITAGSSKTLYSSNISTQAGFWDVKNAGSSGGGGSGDISNGGNYFSSDITIGTNDNFKLNFETNGITRGFYAAGGGAYIGDSDPTLESIVGVLGILITNQSTDSTTTNYVFNTSTGANSKTAITLGAGDPNVDAALAGFQVSAPSSVGIGFDAPNTAGFGAFKGSLALLSSGGDGGFPIDFYPKATTLPRMSVVQSGDGTGAFKLYDTDATNSVGFKAPLNIDADILWDLPSTDGTVGQALVTDGNKKLSWASSGGGTGDINNGGNAFSSDITVGTTDNFDFSLEANNTELVRLLKCGSILFGPPNAVDPFICAVPDYKFVFKDDYAGFAGFIHANFSTDPSAKSSYVLTVGNTLIAANSLGQIFLSSPDDPTTPGALNINANTPGAGGNIFINPDTQTGSFILSSPGGENNIGSGTQTIISAGGFATLVNPTGTTDIDGFLGNDFYGLANTNPTITFANVSEGMEFNIYISNTDASPHTVDAPNTIFGYATEGFPISIPAGQSIFFTFKQINGVTIVKSRKGPY